MKKENVETKSLKERIKENKGKLITIAVCGGILTVSYILYKNTKDIKFINGIVEEGALKDAIDSINRKITYRENKTINIKKEKPYNYNDDENYIRYIKELKDLYIMQELYVNKRNNMKIQDV